MLNKHAIWATALAVPALAGCGGEIHRSAAFVQEGAPGAEVYTAAATVAPSRLQDALLPLLRTGGGDFQIAGLPAPRAADARHMPIYHDGKHLFVGVDQGTGQIGFLQQRHREEGIALLYGDLFDGVGAENVAAYLNEANRSQVPWNRPPTVRVIGAASAEDVARTIRAVQLVNAALPEHAKLSVGASLPSVSLRENLSGSTYTLSGQERANTIHVEWISGSDYLRLRGRRTGAFGVNLGGGRGYIGFNMGANSYPRDDEASVLLAHELMHAVADFGHVSTRFATILEGGTGDIHHPGQNAQRRPMSLLYPVDREALQAFFGPLQGGFGPTDLGAWSEESLHIAGRSPHAAFGVALRNGYSEPWAYGHLPASDLADNRTLSGSATWTGDLLGLTPNGHSVWGDAEIGVQLATLTGRADFTDIVISRSEHRAWSQWLDGDLSYTIAVRGNTFRETGGDDGRLTGVFTGRRHEGAGGTLERSDLTAAFAASR